MRSFVRGFIYQNNIFSKILYQIVYYNWLRRYKRKSGFVFSHNISQYIREENIFAYQPTEQVTFTAPTLLPEHKMPEQIRFYVGKTMNLPGGAAYLFPEAFLVGPEAVGLTTNGDIISDTALDEPIVLHKCSPRMLMNYHKYDIEQEYEYCMSLVNIFSSNEYQNYFHWIVDSILLLEGLKHYEKETGQKMKLIVNKGRTSFQNELISLMGYGPEDLIEWGHQKVRVKNLLVVKSRRNGVNRDEVLSPSALHWLRGTLTGNPEGYINLPNRIFISRSKASNRRVLNQHEISPILEKYNIKEIVLEELSVLEQISIFSQAKWVISIHGASLTNIIFSKEAKVLEIFGEVDNPGNYYFYANYYSMSNVLDHAYYCMTCDTFPIPERKSIQKQIYDVQINPLDFELMLKKMESS